jgi:hypothetical protein
MQKITKTAVVIVFGLVGSAAFAQEIPEQARRDIADHLQGPFRIYRSEVRDDLTLNDAQKDAIEEYLRVFVPEAMQFFQSLEGLPSEEREKKVQEFRQKSQETLLDVLKKTLEANQMKRLHQIGLQQEGVFAAFHSPDVAKELQITDEQRKQFMDILQELMKKVEPLIKEAQSGGDPQQIRPKVMKIRKEHEIKAEGILTEPQKKQWKEMLGKPLPLDE